jgi:hypothetical protein
VAALEDLVDLGFAVAAARLERRSEPVQQDQALAAAGGNGGEAAGVVEIGRDHLGFPGLAARGLAPQGDRAFRIEEAAVEPRQGFEPQRMPAGDALGPGAHQPQRLQRREVMGDGRLLQFQQRGQLLHAALTLGQEADDAQPALIGHGLEEGEQGGEVGVGHRTALVVRCRSN